MDNEHIVNADALNQPDALKLTDWENEPTVSELKQDYIDAKPDQDLHIADVNVWLDNLNISGSAKIPKIKGSSSVAPKVIRKQAEWRYASLSEPFLSTEDMFNVSPITFEDKKAAEQNALVLNNQFNTKIDKIKFIGDYVRTSVDEGTVIVRVGWEYRDEEVEVTVGDFDYRITESPEIAQLHAELHQMMQEEPQRYKFEVSPELQEAHRLTMENQVMIEPIQIGSHLETELKVLKNQPTLEVVNYKNISIDPTCAGDLTKANFIIYSFETSLTELEKAGDKYSNLTLINAEASSILSAPDHDSGEDSSFNFSDKPRKKFVAYEYWGFWDIDGSGITKPIVATYVGDVMIRMEENPFPDQELPFVAVQYLPVRRSVYGQPDGALLEDNQKIIGAITRGMVDVMGKSANGQQGTRKDALDVTNRRKFDKGLDYEFNAGINPEQAFHMHVYPEIPQSAQVMLQLQNQDAESLTGVKAFSSGISGQALGNTATGIRSALDATSKRELDILRRKAKGMETIGRKILSMNSEFLSEEEVVRVTNDEFVTVRRDDLAGNFDLRLTISTAEADNQKAEELAFMLQTTAQTVGVEFTQLILADIAKLRKMPDLAKRIESFQPQPDPLAQEKAMLEIELLKAQIATERSNAIENQAEAQLDMAKAATENAKAGNLSSDTDLKDLEFVEKESGTTQERDKEKITTQAEAQTNMKIMDNLTKPKSTEGSTTTSNGLSQV